MVFRPWNDLSPKAKEENKHLTIPEGVNVLLFEREDERSPRKRKLRYEAIIYNVHHHEYADIVIGFWCRREFWVEQAAFDALLDKD